MEIATATLPAHWRRCPAGIVLLALASVILLALAGITTVRAQGAIEVPDGADSASTTDTVMVVAGSIVPAVVESARPTAVVTRARVEEAGGRDLGDAVALSPGAFVRRYGGLGGLRTVSLRGASAQQSVLLIDGVRYRSSAEGGFDFGNLPAAVIDRVEVIRGGDAALYGANALGGAINVVTGGQGRQGLQGVARGGIGSFGEGEIGGWLLGRDGAHRFDLGTNLVISDGDYPFRFEEFGRTETVVRENGDFSNLFGRVAWALSPEDGWGMNLSAQGYATDRGVPGPAVRGNRERGRTRLEEKDLFAVARAERTLAGWNASLALSGRLNGVHYVDPDARLGGPEGIDYRFDRREASAGIGLLRAVGTSGLFRTTIELEHARLDGDNLDPSVGRSVERTRVGGAVRFLYDVTNSAVGKSLMLDGAIRGDLFSDLGANVAPSIALLWRPSPLPLRFRLHGALSYRAPTFTEQYYLNYGTKDLRTERASLLSLGATYALGEGLALESSLFLIDTRDQIVAIPRSPISWSASNVGRVLSRGFEIGFVGAILDNGLSGQLSYTLMRAEDRTEGITEGHLLPYTPEEIAAGVITVRPLRSLRISASWEYASHRYTLAYNSVQGVMPRYAILGAGIAWDEEIAGLDITLRLDVSNLLDTDYEVVRNYPMPGRSGRVSVECRFGIVE